MKISELKKKPKAKKTMTKMIKMKVIKTRKKVKTMKKKVIKKVIKMKEMKKEMVMEMEKEMVMEMEKEMGKIILKKKIKINKCISNASQIIFTNIVIQKFNTLFNILLIY